MFSSRKSTYYSGFILYKVKKELRDGEWLKKKEKNRWEKRKGELKKSKEIAIARGGV